MKRADKFHIGQEVYANRGGAILSYIVQERTAKGYVIRRKGFDTLVHHRTQDVNRWFSTSRQDALLTAAARARAAKESQP